MTPPSNWALSTRCLSDVNISLLPDGLFLLTMAIIGGRYIIYAGGSLTKNSGMYCVPVLLANPRPIFELDQNQDIWERIHPSLTILYYRLVGARIGRGIFIHDRKRLFKCDLITLQDDCHLDTPTLRGLCVERDGHFRLERIIIGRQAFVNTYTSISPGFQVPDGSVYGPHASSHDTPSPNTFTAYNRTLLKEPRLFLKVFVAWPIMIFFFWNCFFIRTGFSLPSSRSVTMSIWMYAPWLPTSFPEAAFHWISSRLETSAPCEQARGYSLEHQWKTTVCSANIPFWPRATLPIQVSHMLGGQLGDWKTNLRSSKTTRETLLTCRCLTNSLSIRKYSPVCFESASLH